MSPGPWTLRGRLGGPSGARRVGNDLWPSAPEVEAISARPEPVRLDHRRGIGEAMADQRRLMGVTTERDRLAARLVPPSDDLGVASADGC